MQKKKDKRATARKNAEAQKAQKKAIRMSNSNTGLAAISKKGKSLVPQAKKKK